LETSAYVSPEAREDFGKRKGAAERKEKQRTAAAAASSEVKNSEVINDGGEGSILPAEKQSAAVAVTASSSEVKNSEVINDGGEGEASILPVGGSAVGRSVVGSVGSVVAQSSEVKNSEVINDGGEDGGEASAVATERWPDFVIDCHRYKNEDKEEDGFPQPEPFEDIPKDCDVPWFEWSEKSVTEFDGFISKDKEEIVDEGGSNGFDSIANEEVWRPAVREEKDDLSETDYDSVPEEKWREGRAHYICQWSHNWEELDKPGYVTTGVLHGRYCYNCAIRFVDGKRRLPWAYYLPSGTNLGSHCTRCGIAVCAACRAEYDLKTPPRNSEPTATRSRREGAGKRKLDGFY
jgi:hypothetical protein